MCRSCAAIQAERDAVIQAERNAIQAERNAIQAELRYVIMIQEIRTGNLLTVQPSIVLSSEEICYWDTPATYHKPLKASVNQQTDLSPEARREALDDLRDLVTRGNDGDEEALARVDTVLEQIPSIARKFGNLNIMVEEGFVERTATNNPLRQKSLRINLENMREELAGSNPSPLEKLGAERIASCWLQLHYAELIYNQELPNLSWEQNDYHQKRLDRLHRRYLSSMRSLAQVRKLLKPKVAQINIGEKQQINTLTPLNGPGREAG